MDYGAVRLPRNLERGSNVGFLVATRAFDGEVAGSMGLEASHFFTDTLGTTAKFLQVHGPTSDNGRAWLDLVSPEGRDTTTIHVFDALYAFTPDSDVMLFVQSNSAIEKENVQALWVWRIKPPFGSLQLAYQTGTSFQGQESAQDDTLFVKLAWVFE